MSAIHVKEYTIEVYTHGVLDEVEVTTRKAAQDLARQALNTLLPAEEVEIEAFGLITTLEKGQPVEIFNEAAGTKLVIKPFVEKKH